MVALDVETTLEEPRVLCTVQLGIANQSWIIDALAMKDLAPLKRLMENDAVEKVIHNAFFEEQMLGKHGIRIHGVFDTLHHSRSKHKKTPGLSHKLGDVCERELGIYLDKSNQTSDWTLRPLAADQILYAAIDVEVLVDLYPVFKPPKPPVNLELFLG
jgi:ribonuclease D